MVLAAAKCSVLLLLQLPAGTSNLFHRFQSPGHCSRLLVFLKSSGLFQRGRGNLPLLQEGVCPAIKLQLLQPISRLVTSTRQHLDAAAKTTAGFIKEQLSIPVKNTSVSPKGLNVSYRVVFALLPTHTCWVWPQTSTVQPCPSNLYFSPSLRAQTLSRLRRAAPQALTGAQPVQKAATAAARFGN